MGIFEMKTNYKILYYCLLLVSISFSETLLINSTAVYPNWSKEVDGFTISDTQYTTEDNFYHLLKIKKDSSIFYDTFYIPLRAYVDNVNVRLFKTFSSPLVLERYYVSKVVGSTFEIRVFDEIGTPYCKKETFNNDGGPFDPAYTLKFSEELDEPLIIGMYMDSLYSCQNLSCTHGPQLVSIYILDTENNTIYYNTANKKKQVLITDKFSVFNVLEISESKLWVIVSKMSANPNEAHGTNEEKLLIYIPKKKIKTISDFHLPTNIY